VTPITQQTAARGARIVVPPERWHSFCSADQDPVVASHRRAHLLNAQSGGVSYSESDKDHAGDAIVDVDDAVVVAEVTRARLETVRQTSASVAQRRRDAYASPHAVAAAGRR
jgi:hypothetical protein